MHKHNIVHRDLKLENIVYSQMDTHGSIIDFSKVVLKLIDFGFSTTSVLGKTDLKGLTGTAYFMAPEIITNQAYGSKVDIWSLGVISYILISGQDPFYSKEWEELCALIKKGEFKMSGSPIWEAVSPECKNFIQ